tara:strand:- start:614 stop:772 length:159 start_codon:yes stop_codon:yes gene_type:complete
MVKNKQTLDLTKQIEMLEQELKQTKHDNLMLAKEVDRLNEYVQIMELERKNK